MRIAIAASVFALGTWPAGSTKAEEPAAPDGPMLAFRPPSAVVKFVCRTTTIDRLENKALDEATRILGKDPAARGWKRVEREVALEVGAADEKGGRPVTIRFGRASVETRSDDGKVTRLTSDKPLPRDSRTELLASEELFLARMEVTGQFDAAGRLGGIVVPESAEEQRRKALGLAKDRVGLGATALFPHVVEDEVRRALFPLPLPGGAAKPGLAWDSTTACTKSHSGGQSLVTVRLEVSEAGAGGVTVSGKGAVTIKARSVPKSLEKHLGSVELRASSASATATLSPGDGLPLRGVLEARHAYTTKGGMSPGTKGDAEQTIEIERVEKWPSESDAPKAPGGRK